MQKILINRYNKIKEYISNIPALSDIHEDELNLVWSYRQSPNFRRMIERNVSWKTLCYNIQALKKIGAANTQEKYHLVYGKTQGQKLWDAYRFNSAVTEKNLIDKYGSIQGKIRWEKYRKKQAYSNSFDYKHKKLGWTEEEFSEYNLSRACTLENFIRRHGTKLGAEKWKEYCDRQSFTNTKEYLGDSYELVNQQKSLSLPNFIRKYGEKVGQEKFYEYVNRSQNFYSKKSIELFDEIIEQYPIKGLKTYYATNNGEYGIWSDNYHCLYKYDFVCPELKFAIEFNGDVFHGNPIKYKPNEYLHGRGCTHLRAKDKWELDKIKCKELFTLRGYDVIIVWEHDFDNNKNEIIKKIIEYAKLRIK
jgi:very-short-patch-repair endonuclease